MANRWCDYSCKYAGFPESPDLLGACRTMAAVHCMKLGRTVPKHTLCWYQKSEPKPSEDGLRSDEDDGGPGMGPVSERKV
jgi:hypothetical protein